MPDSVKYSVIYADPPWRYNARNHTGTRFGMGAAGHYPTLSLSQIKALPVETLAADDAMLFLWVTFPRLREGLEVIDSWGFDYRTLGFSWIKLNKDGSPFFGVGYYAKSNCEVCLLGVRGRPIKASDSVSSVVLTTRERHSKKPAEVRQRIEKLCGDVPRIELFARELADGWDSWGDEIESMVSLGEQSA